MRLAKFKKYEIGETELRITQLLGRQRYSALVIAKVLYRAAGPNHLSRVRYMLVVCQVSLRDSRNKISQDELKDAVDQLRLKLVLKRRSA
jgi:hypothetical protein